MSLPPAPRRGRGIPPCRRKTIIVNEAGICTVEHLRHVYGDRTALEDISFSLHRGTVVGLVGANGSGKSTLLRILAGVQRASAGRVEQFGTDISAHESVGRGVGAATDGMAMWPTWTVRKNLTYLARLSGASRGDVARVAELVDIAAEMRTRLSRLSLGNRQRLSLAAAILVGTELVLLDEPMNGLDPDARQRIRELLIQLSGEGRTVLLSSHDLHEVESSCSHLLVLDRGRLVFGGPTNDFVGTHQMTILRMSRADTDRAQVLLTHAGLHCRRDSSGAPVVFSHDASAANRVLGEAGIPVLTSEERHATLEERFHDRPRQPAHGEG
ncbi:ABC transporter ATP-binding protein [uncultured Modestobacter sp.]|uniref:ABC transporter ATP-binding protein n=1 Tax=uncultured Modestobacter sp. TaxID=380048 RepID=UPI0026019043|nr:ABC transporter ATP-binding protein [uncultured Modestobacter sp.]